MPELHIVIALYPGVTQLDFTGPYQVFVAIPDTRVTVASIGGQDIDAGGFAFTALADLTDIGNCDVLCVPGGSGVTEALLDDAFMQQIRRLGALATYRTSVCTGSLILGAAGFLVGRRATTHWALRELPVHFGAIASEARVERDGNVITGGGVTAGIDFALTLAAELRGRDIAQAIQRGLEYAPAPPFACGTPDQAGAEIVARLTAALAQERAQCVNAVAAAAGKLQNSGSAYR